MRFFAAATISLLAASLNLGCAQGPAQETGKIKVLTTIVPLYSFAANVAGDAAEVENLLRGQAGPHDFQLAPSDMLRVRRADVVILNGLGLESWMERALGAVEGGRRRVVKVTDGMEDELIHGGHEHEEGDHDDDETFDPHIWLDPRLAAKAVERIAEALKAADPKNAEIYDRNAREYLAKLQTLDKELETLLAPVRPAPFVTYHDAFGYLVRRYQLNLVAVVEETPDVQPSFRDLRRLLQTIRNERVKVIFTEPQFSSKLATQISRDTGVPLAELDPLETGELAVDAYEEAMRKNGRALAARLK